MNKEEIIENKISVISKYTEAEGIFLAPEEKDMIINFVITQNKSFMGVIRSIDNLISNLGPEKTRQTIDYLKQASGIVSNTSEQQLESGRGKAFVKTNPNVIPYIVESNKAA